MTTAVQLVREAKKAGVTLSRVGDRIIARGPKSAGPIVEQVLARKTEIIHVLPKRRAPAACGHSNQPCDQLARFYPCGWRCDHHAPATRRDVR